MRLRQHALLVAGHLTNFQGAVQKVLPSERSIGDESGQLFARAEHNHVTIVGLWGVTRRRLIVFNRQGFEHVGQRSRAATVLPARDVVQRDLDSGATDINNAPTPLFDVADPSMGQILPFKSEPFR
jgi:hypothetical protein